MDPPSSTARGWLAGWRDLREIRPVPQAVESVSAPPPDLPAVDSISISISRSSPESLGDFSSGLQSLSQSPPFAFLASVAAGKHLYSYAFLQGRVHGATVHCLYRGCDEAVRWRISSQDQK